MNAFPSAVRRFGYAAMETRAARTREAMQAQAAAARRRVLERVARGELTAEEALALLEDRP